MSAINNQSLNKCTSQLRRVPLRFSTSSSIRPTDNVGTFKYTSAAEEAALDELVTVGVRVVELVIGGVASVALAAVCAATCKAYVDEASNTQSSRHIATGAIFYAAMGSKDTGQSR